MQVETAHQSHKLLRVKADSSCAGIMQTQARNGSPSVSCKLYVVQALKLLSCGRMAIRRAQATSHIQKVLTMAPVPTTTHCRLDSRRDHRFTLRWTMTLPIKISPGSLTTISRESFKAPVG